MQENETCPLDDCADSPEKPNEEDLQGNMYEFYLLLQKLKAGGMSFDMFLEQALEWATMRDITARRP
jgi:hypothetical protein